MRPIRGEGVGRGLTIAVVGVITSDKALEVGGFMEEGGEEVIFAVGGGVRGYAIVDFGNKIGG